MSWKNIHANDYGIRLRLTLKEDEQAVDLSTYTTLQYVLVDPNENAQVVTAEFDTDGTDGKLAYILAEDVIDQDGEWKVAARISKINTRITSEFVPFVVLANYE